MRAEQGPRTGEIWDPSYYWTARQTCVLMTRMQTLGLSDSLPRSDSRLKSLFWPSIETGTDVDYLGEQGYWVCTLVAAFALVFALVTGHAATGVFLLLFYYLGGVGVRERSRYAAAMVFALFIIDTLALPSIPKVFFAALLLSNLRATWIASTWKPESERGALPTRMRETWSDQFADQFPLWLWPKLRVFYYIFSACVLLLFSTGMAVMILRRFR